MKKQWNRKTIIGIVCGVVVILTAIGITIFLLLSGGEKPAPAPEPKPAPGANTDSEAGEKEVPETKVADSLWEPAPFDNSGMVEMIVTTNPEEAALAAARVLWSADAAKQPFHEDFVREALTRVMHPSPDYVGAEGVLRGTIDRSKSNLGHTEWVTGDLVETAIANADDANWNPDGGWWWELGEEARYNALTGHGIRYSSHPIEAVTGTEAEELGLPIELEEIFEADSLPGTYSKYWVRVESSIDAGGESGSELHRVRNATSLLIYCDAPEDGGICGVAGLTKSYPKQWQRQ